MAVHLHQCKEAREATPLARLALRRDLSICSLASTRAPPAEKSRSTSPHMRKMTASGLQPHIANGRGKAYKDPGRPLALAAAGTACPARRWAITAKHERNPNDVKNI